MTAKVEINIKDCPITSVQIYLDRAEVTRRVSLSGLDESQEEKEYSLDLVGMVIKAEPESIRVKGNKGAKILEVSNSKKVIAQETPATKALMEKKKELMEEKKLNRQEYARQAESITLMKKFTESAFVRVDNQPPKSVQEAREVMEYYLTENERVGREHIRLSREHEALEDQINVINNDIDSILGEQGEKKGQHMSRIAHIKLLRSPGAGEAEDLILTYMVSDSRWAPSYDVRINSEKKTMVMTYYAEVSQRSGEAWEDVEMLLSTSNPSIGSTPKSLPKIIARDYVYNNNLNQFSGMQKNGLPMKKSKSLIPQARMASAGAQSLQQQAVMNGGGGGDEEESGEDDDDSECDSVGAGYGESAKVTGGDSVGTGFSIPRKVSIQSNASSSKVVVREFTLNPTIVHYTVPSTGDSSVYLQAKTANTTELVLLASAKVNIFVDGAFISKSNLRQTNAGSNFYMFLGVDPGVKCSFKEIKSENKGATWTNSNKCKEKMFNTTVYNTKSGPIKLLVADALPKSTDEKIIVETLDPRPNQIKPMGSGQNGIYGLAGLESGIPDGVFKDEATNTLTWVSTVPPQQKTMINFHYNVFFPPNVNLELAKT